MAKSKNNIKIIKIDREIPEQVRLDFIESWQKVMKSGNSEPLISFPPDTTIQFFNTKPV